MAGGAGRAARPAKLKLANGRTGDTDSGGRKVNAGPAFQRFAPDPPAWLSSEAAKEWRRIVPELTRVKLIKPIDSAGLAAYCEAWSRFVDASITYDEGGKVQLGRVQSCSTELRQWAREFGLTPSAEGSVRAPDLPDEDDPFAG